MQFSVENYEISIWLSGSLSIFIYILRKQFYFGTFHNAFVNPITCAKKNIYTRIISISPQKHWNLEILENSEITGLSTETIEKVVTVDSLDSWILTAITVTRDNNLHFLLFE